METQRYRTPLWFELLMLAGFVRLVNKLAGEDGNAAGRGAATVTERLSEVPEATAERTVPNRRPSAEPHHIQLTRARERGRGRDAPTPLHIPLAGWRDIVWRVLHQIGEDRLLAVAAGVVFYSLLALFPAITALVSIYGLIADAGTINEHLNLIAQVVPEGGLSIIRDQVTRIASSSSQGLSLAFIISLVVALWSANAGMKAIIDALNVVYDEREKRSFIHLTLVSFAFTIGAIVVVILAVNAVIVLPLVLSWVGLSRAGNEWLAVLRWPGLVVLVLAGLAVLYRFGPSRARPKWRWISVGSLFAAVVWLSGSWLFSWYLSNFANYQATYGSLGAAIGLMMWMWISVIVILVGGEINAEVEHQTAVDTTANKCRPLGARGATMADTVGASSAGA